MPHPDFSCPPELPHPTLQHLLTESSLELGLDLHLVGGSVRDLLLGREVHDLDYVVSGSSDRLAHKVAGPLKAKLACLDDTFGVMRLILPDGLQVDLANRQGESLESDLLRRDCTMNAIALTLVENGEASDNRKLVDPTGGLADLGARVVKAVSLENLLADPVRILRILRIAATHGCSVDLETLFWIESNIRWLQEAPGERVAAEWLQLLARPDAHRWIERLLGLGILEIILPEITPLRKIVRGPAKEPWIFVEALDRLSRFDKAIPQFRSEHPESAALLDESLATRLPGGTSLVAALRLGLVLLDVGRPWCREHAPDGQVVFPGHPEEGARRARTVAARLKLASRTSEVVTTMVARQEALEAWREAPDSPVSRFRLFRALGQGTPALLLSVPPEEREAANAALVAYLDPRGTLTRPVRLLTGDVARRELDVEPGPGLGRLLERALEAQLAGAFQDVDGALSWARTEGGGRDA